MFGKLTYEAPTPFPYPPIAEARRIAFKNSQKYHLYSKHDYDKSHNPIIIKEGDMVLILNKNKIQRRKLEPIWLGPFEVKKKISNVLYEVIYNEQTRKSDVVHIRNMKLFKTN